MDFEQKPKAEGQGVEKTEAPKEEIPGEEPKAEAPEEEINSEGLEKAGKAAETKLADLEAKIQENWKETHGLEENQSKEGGAASWLRSGTATVVSLGGSRILAKFLEGRRTKKLKAAINRKDAERKDLSLKKMKITDPERYQKIMADREKDSSVKNNIGEQLEKLRKERGN